MKPEIKPTERFSNRVENYVKFRPDYPPQVVALMRERMNLNENSIVADVGSGTGIFARLLLETGCTVYGVEPNQPMRGAAEEFLRGFPNFKSVDAAAEQTGLPAQSVTLATAAQAFHWFDAKQTGAEFARILQPGGFAALVWNDRQLDSTSFLRDYERFLLEFGTDYSQVRHDKLGAAQLREFFPEDFHENVFSNVQAVDFEGLKGRLLSASYAPDATHPRFAEMLAELHNIFARHRNAGKVEILYDTRVFYGKF